MTITLPSIQVIEGRARKNDGLADLKLQSHKMKTYFI